MKKARQIGVGEIIKTTKTLAGGLKMECEHYFDESGVARWVSNNHAIDPKVAKENGIRANAKLQAKACAAETELAIAEYVENREKNGYSEEEIGEMRAAFGPESNVIDIFTGKRINL